MNQRITAIIHLLKDSSDPPRITDLAARFQVSQRTIRNDLNEINALLKQNHLPELDLRSGGQIHCPDTFDQLLPFILTGDFYTYKLSPEERKRVAAALLVNAAGYITLAEIAEHLFVSRATIIHDLDDIKTYIRENGMEVQSYAIKGLLAVGPESRKRMFLLRLLQSDLSAQRELITRHISVQAGNRVILQKLLGEQEHVCKSFLTDASFQDILLYLGILVNRNRQGLYLEPQPAPEGDKYLMAQNILKYVVQYCSVTITEDDIRALFTLLNHARYMRHSSFEKDAVKIQMITRQFISGVSEALEINLNNDYDFFENLSNHLESVFSAPPASYPERAVIDEVLEDHQDVVEAVRVSLPLLAHYISREVTDMEVAYIAIHVCAAIERRKNKEIAFHVIVACHAGIGTSQLHMEKLKKHFNFQIVDIISAHEAKHLPADKADFVISTVPLPECRLDYVIVSPTFSDSDYMRVGSKIDALRDSRHLPSRVSEKDISAKGMIEKIRPIVYEEVPDAAPALMKKLRRVIRDYFNQSLEAEAEIFSPYLHHLLPQTNIELDVECADWRDAVRRSAVKMVERGYIESRYIDAMIANIEENGPYIVLTQGFAMPHEGLEQGSIRVGMHLIRLKTPVPFGAEALDPVEFVCCLSAVDHRTHLKAFFNLVNMLRDDDFKEQLHLCRTSEEAAQIIEKYEYSILG